MHYQRSVVMTILSLLAWVPLHSKTFELRGQQFPVLEENLIEKMRSSLTHSVSTQKIVALQQQMLTNALNPAAVENIRSASQNRTFYIDPSIVVKSDILDHQGRVIVKAGTTINPLKKLNVHSSLLFINGENKEHLIWARAQKGNCKWMLVKGKPFDLERQEKRPIYFDQDGSYSNRFHIQHTPAKVSQLGEKLLVEEIALGNKEDTK
jgi:conjugal transfer pilus assembly protein TraW